MSAGHLVALGDLPSLGDPQPHQLVDSWRQFVTVRPAEYPHVDYLAALTVWYPQRCIFNVPRLLPEYRSQELFLGAELRFTLGSYFADQDIARADLGADAYDPILIQISQALLANVGYIACDLLRPELGIARLHFVLTNVDGGKAVVLYQRLAQDDRILKVVALPAHERDQDVLAQGQLSPVCRGAIAEDLPRVHVVAAVHYGSLVYASPLVGSEELAQLVFVLHSLAIDD